VWLAQAHGEQAGTTNSIGETPPPVDTLEDGATAVRKHEQNTTNAESSTKQEQQGPVTTSTNTISLEYEGCGTNHDYEAYATIEEPMVCWDGGSEVPTAHPMNQCKASPLECSLSWCPGARLADGQQLAQGPVAASENTSPVDRADAMQSMLYEHTTAYDVFVDESIMVAASDKAEAHDVKQRSH
jgi:hypothetical protein